MKKTVVISDIHGHYDQLMQIFDRFMDNDWYGVDPNKDVFVFLGDYVDGGPDTKGVIDELISLKEQFPHWKFLVGNHESLLIDALSKNHPVYGDYYLWWNQGGKATLESYKPKQSLKPDEYEKYQRSIMQPLDLIPKEHLDFIMNLDLYYETDDYFFVHGGVYPNTSIQDHKKMIEEQYPLGFNLGLMREGDIGYDMIWIREQFIRSSYSWGKKIIFGHTTWPYGIFLGENEHGEPMMEPGYPFIMNNKIGIDTMRHDTGRLTAVILPEEKFVFSDWSNE